MSAGRWILLLMVDARLRGTACRAKDGCAYQVESAAVNRVGLR
jgi:hypothetical protein